MVVLTRRLSRALLLVATVTNIYSSAARPSVPTAFSSAWSFTRDGGKVRTPSPRRRSHHRGYDTRSRPSGGPLHLSRYDNLLSGVAEISMGFSLGVLWSEYAVLTTGCGPVAFSDTLERLCYQGVILAAGSSVFSRIAFGKGLVRLSEDSFGYLEDATLWQVRAAEILSLLGVAGAFVALGSQIIGGERMDGLSGIDVEMCRALREL